MQIAQKPSRELRSYLQQRIAEVREGARGLLSEDGSALLVYGGPGWCGFVSPDGDVFGENYLNRTYIERGPRTQVEVLVLGVRAYPVLQELLPHRRSDATTCENCAGKGFVWLKYAKIATNSEVICKHCSGLGWVSPSMFEK